MSKARLYGGRSVCIPNSAADRRRTAKGWQRRKDAADSIDRMEKRAEKKYEKRKVGL